MTAPTEPVAPEAPRPPRLNPRKLLLGKWTAVRPRDKEKHFIVTRVLPRADDAGRPLPALEVEIEAVHTGRRRVIAWRELTDTTRWRQGWR